MKINKYIKVFLLAIILLAITSVFVSAAGENNLTVNITGVSSNILNTTFYLNLSFVNKAGAGNDAFAGYYGAVVNFTFYMKSALTANGSDGGWVIIGSNNSVNMTSNTTTRRFDFTQGSPMLEDSNDYILNVSVYNDTADSRLYLNSTLYSINLTVDNSVPIAPSSLLPTSDTDNTVNFTATMENSNTTKCYINFTNYNPGKPSYTASYSGTSCSYQLTNVPEQSYIWYITASDGLNSTSSSTQNTKVDVKTSAGKAALLIAEGKAKSEGGALLSVIGENGIFKGNNWVWIIVGITGIIVITVIVKRRK